jgi:hypothetical protein
MADQITGAAGAQAASDTQPPAGDPPTQADGGTVEQPQPETISFEEARKLRSEANSLRKRLKELEEAQSKATEAKLSETERLTKRAADLERELADRDRLLQERTVSSRTVETAARLGFRNPELAYRLLDQSELDFGEDGQPKNVEPLLRALLDKEPYLAKTPGDFGGGNRGTTPSGTPDMDGLLRAAVRGG